MTTRDPGMAAAAAAQTAAEEGSPGTRRRDAAAVTRCPPGTRTRSPSTSHVKPNNGNARSVWSRVAAVSTTVVVPEANRPASMTALLTWALGTAGVQVMPVSASRPSITRGARPSCEVMTAPIAVSGSITRRIGRRWMDSSPVRVD